MLQVVVLVVLQVVMLVVFQVVVLLGGAVKIVVGAREHGLAHDQPHGGPVAALDAFQLVGHAHRLAFGVGLDRVHHRELLERPAVHLRGWGFG